MKSLIVGPRTALKSKLFVVLLVSGCSSRNAPTTFPNVSPAQQAKAAQVMRLKFPADTRFMSYDYQSGGMDDAAWLKIELSPTALEQLLRQPPLNTAKWENSAHPMANHQGVPNWLPENVMQFRYSQFELPSAEALNVLIDDSRADLKIVYLEWMER